MPAPPADPMPDPAATDADLLQALRRENGSSRALVWLRRVTDHFLPDRLREETLEARRRARFVVITTLIEVPFLGVLVQQLLANGLQVQATVAICFGLIVLMCPLLLRVTRSHRLAGATLVLTTTAALFFQAYSDAGIADPILYWVAVMPLIGAMLGGLRLSLASAGLNLVGVGGLYALARAGHAFPELTPPVNLQLAALLSLATVTVFALVWGWVYEGLTLREERRTVSQLQRLRSALTASEARYQALFDGVPVGLYRSSAAGEMLMANRALLRMLGYASVDELIRAGGVYEEGSERRRFVQSVDEGSAPFATTWRGRGGRTLSVRERAHAVRDGAGRVLYYEGTAEDVTAQRQVQHALRQSEERFRALVQHASDLTVVIDEAGVVTYASPSAERLFGLSAQAMVGAEPMSWVHPEDLRRIRSLDRWVRGRPGQFGPVEFRAVRPDGPYLYVEVVGANLLDNPHVGGLVLNVRDVTERKRAEAVLVRSKEQAEEVARLKSAFLANMSHEIRTPLTGILGFTSVLAEEVTDPQQAEFVSLIEKSGRRLMDTLNSVLELARLEAGRADLASEAVCLADAVNEAVGLMAPMATDKGLRLGASIVQADAQAQLDRAALDRVLTNLIGNAIKFTETGEVVVEVDADEHAVILRVRDTGVGIDPDFVPRLFYDFEQESTGISRSHEGSGLGLAISRQLVERMRGSIAVDSSKGLGTTFSVTFPRSDTDPAVAEAGRTLPRVLVVDDNLNTRNLMERMLCTEYDVTCLADATSALRATDEGPAFAAVLLDINLGGEVSGEEVMRRLRRTDAYGGAPIMAFTAYALPGDRERFLHTGFSGYLAKPFTRAQLLEAVSELFGNAGSTPSGDGAWRRPTAPRATGR